MYFSLVFDYLVVNKEEYNFAAGVGVAGTAYRRRKLSCSCQNDGQCDARGRCLCRAGYSGASCQLRANQMPAHHPTGKLGDRVGHGSLFSDPTRPDPTHVVELMRDP